MKTCLGCGKETNEYTNYCSWDCSIAYAKANGGVVHTPNGLPIKSITAQGLMIEHEHGDHPDYKFPVEIEYFGSIDADMHADYEMMCSKKGTEEEVRDFQGQTHALIYQDGSVAVTMYECCYAMWYLRDGSCGGGSLWSKETHQLSQESRDKIKRKI